MLLFTVVLSACLGGLVAPTPEKDSCQILVERAYRHLPTVGGATEGRTIHLEMITRTYFKAPGQNKPQQKTTTLSIYTNGLRSYYDSPEAEVFQDEHRVVTILKKQRQIYLTKPIGQAASQQLQQLTMMRDSVLHYAEMVACQPAQAPYDPSVVRHVKLRVGEPMRTRVHLRTLEFWVDAGQQQVKKMAFVYMPGRGMDRLEMEFIQQEENVKTDKLDRQAKDLLLDKTGKRLARYAGFQLIDQSGR